MLHGFSKHLQYLYFHVSSAIFVWYNILVNEMLVCNDLACQTPLVPIKFRAKETPNTKQGENTMGRHAFP